MGDWIEDPVLEEAREYVRRGDAAGLRSLLGPAADIGMLDVWELAALAAGGGHADCLAFLLSRCREHCHIGYAEPAFRNGHDAIVEQIQRHADATSPNYAPYLAAVSGRLRAALRAAGDDAAAREAAFNEFCHVPPTPEQYAQCIRR